MSSDQLHYKPSGIKERFNSVLARCILCLEKKNSAVDTPEVDIYASAMTYDFNWLHGVIYPHFFEKIHVETENLEQIRELAKTGTIIYVTKDIGQLEYNFFNYFFLNEQLPLARFVNELSLWQWLPYKQLKEIAFERARSFKAYGPLPHPVASGYAGAMIETGATAFIRLKTSHIFNDLYWYEPKEDPLVAVLAANERSLKPVYIVPLQFLWDKRPNEKQGSILGILPKFIRKNVAFWRNYKNRAVVKIGAPIQLDPFIESYKNVEISERARCLRAALLEHLQLEKKVITGPALKPRKWLIEETLEDDVLQKVIYEVAAEKKSSLEDVKELARKYINETASDVSYNYIEVGFRIMRWVLKNIYDGIGINIEGINELKKASSRAPAIVV